MADGRRLHQRRGNRKRVDLSAGQHVPNIKFRLWNKLSYDNLVLANYLRINKFHS